MPAAPPAAPATFHRDPSAGFEDETWTARTGVRMTLEEFAALPHAEDVTRYLIDGEVWEYPVTVRSRPHASCEARTAAKLFAWLDEHLPGGDVGSGEVAVQLPGRTTRLGIDVALFDADTVAAQPPPPGENEGMWVWHGLPRLAAEVMSDSDRVGNVNAKVREYLTAGVPVVWVADPGLKAVTVHRPGVTPRTYGGDDLIPGGEELPGLAVRAGDLFG